MRKLISSILGCTILFSSITTIVSCSANKKTELELDRMVGTDIVKENNINYQVKPTNNLKNGYSDFFVIGDSLSDGGAANAALGLKIKSVLNIIANDEETLNPIVKQIAKKYLNIDLNDAAINLLVNNIAKGLIHWDKLKINISIVDSKENKKNYFADNGNFAMLFAKYLGFDISPNNVTPTDDDKKIDVKPLKFNSGYKMNVNGTKLEKYGRNYAFAGSTASIGTGIKSMLFDDLRVGEQARTLIQQHEILPNDLVLIESGSSDLSNMVNISNKNEKNSLMQSAVNNVKKAILTLLNNGVKNIVYTNAMDEGLFPIIPDDKKSYASELTNEYNQNIKTTVDKISSEYSSDENINIKSYDMNSKFNQIISESKNKGTNINKESVDFIISDKTKSNFKDLYDDITSIINGPNDDIVNFILHIIRIGTFLETFLENINFQEKLVDGVKQPDPKDGEGGYVFYDKYHPRTWVQKQFESDLEKQIKK